MSEHVGYDKHAVEGRNGGNSRNGTRAKTVLTDNAGAVQVQVRVCPTKGVTGVDHYRVSAAGMRSAKVTAKALSAGFQALRHEPW
jgi:transposase-like protein